MKIEFLLAWEDRTWTTEIFDVPDSVDRSCVHDLQFWAQALVGELAAYRAVVLVAVYNSEPGPDDPRMQDDAKEVSDD